MSDARKLLPKPSGWTGAKDDAFWTKSSAYGQRYKCSECGRDVLATSGDKARMHFSKCSQYPPPPTAEEIRAKALRDLRWRLTTVKWADIGDETCGAVGRLLGILP